MDSNDLKKLFGCFGLIAASALSMIFSGLVLQIMWAWYIAPLFSIRELTIPEALGLYCTTWLLTYRDAPQKESRGWEKVIAEMFSHAPITLLIGLVIRWWM